MKKILNFFLTLFLAFYLTLPALTTAAETLNQTDPLVTETDDSEPATIAGEQLDPQLASCLKEKLGEETFDSFKTGDKDPTDADETASEDCFQQHGPQDRKSVV